MHGHAPALRDSHEQLAPSVAVEVETVVPAPVARDQGQRNGSPGEVEAEELGRGRLGRGRRGSCLRQAPAAGGREQRQGRDPGGANGEPSHPFIMHIAPPAQQADSCRGGDAASGIMGRCPVSARFSFAVSARSGSP